MMIPLALMIGYALDCVILLALQTKEEPPIRTGEIQKELEQVLGGKVTRYFILFLFAYCLMSAYTTGQNIKDNTSLHSTDLEAFTWVHENTSADSQFLLITNQHPFRDAWSEWFPVITDRRSQATVFGYEWVNDGKFKNRVDAYNDLQACAYQDTDCLVNWGQQYQIASSYIYIWNQSSPSRIPLTVHLEQNPDFSLVYQNPQTMIFQRVR